MVKKVEHNGKRYKISRRNYGYTCQKLIVNGEESDVNIRNTDVNNIAAWKNVVQRAITEYEDRQIARNEFNKWDGKL